MSLDACRSRRLTVSNTSDTGQTFPIGGLSAGQHGDRRCLAPKARSFKATPRFSCSTGCRRSVRKLVATQASPQQKRPPIMGNFEPARRSHPPPPGSLSLIRKVAYRCRFKSTGKARASVAVSPAPSPRGENALGEHQRQVPGANAPPCAWSLGLSDSASSPPGRPGELGTSSRTDGHHWRRGVRDLGTQSAGRRPTTLGSRRLFRRDHGAAPSSAPQAPGATHYEALDAKIAPSIERCFVRAARPKSSGTLCNRPHNWRFAPVLHATPESPVFPPHHPARDGTPPALLNHCNSSGKWTKAAPHLVFPRSLSSVSNPAGVAQFFSSDCAQFGE
jgi:hypothetical protein